MAGPGGRPLWLRLLVILAVLVAVLGFADQVFRIVVQRQVSAALSTALRAEPAVEVELHDWPFATSVLSNRLESASLRADTAVPYGRVVEVMGVVQQAGLSRIAFVADPVAAPKP